jgi:hypothetical protein
MHRTWITIVIAFVLSVSANLGVIHAAPDDPSAGQAGPSARHGGVMSMTKGHAFETVISPFGIRVYLPSRLGNFPALCWGERISVRGVTETRTNEREIELADVRRALERAHRVMAKICGAVDAFESGGPISDPHPRPQLRPLQPRSPSRRGVRPSLWSWTRSRAMT